ncbi:hypothetical protein D9M71_690250 [compost metagenome]
MGPVKALAPARAKAQGRGQAGLHVVQAFQSQGEFLAAGIAPGALERFFQQLHGAPGADLQQALAAIQALALAHGGERRAALRCPVAGNKRIGEKHAPRPGWRHQQQLTGDLV